MSIVAFIACLFAAIFVAGMMNDAFWSEEYNSFVGYAFLLLCFLVLMMVFGVEAFK